MIQIERQLRGPTCESCWNLYFRQKEDGNKKSQSEYRCKRKDEKVSVNDKACEMYVQTT